MMGFPWGNSAGVKRDNRNRARGEFVGLAHIDDRAGLVVHDPHEIVVIDRWRAPPTPGRGEFPSDTAFSYWE
jgi:hypothetical protein